MKTLEEVIQDQEMDKTDAGATEAMAIAEPKAEVVEVIEYDDDKPLTYKAEDLTLENSNYHFSPAKLDKLVRTFVARSGDTILSETEDGYVKGTKASVTLMAAVVAGLDFSFQEGDAFLNCQIDRLQPSVMDLMTGDAGRKTAAAISFGVSLGRAMAGVSEEKIEEGKKMSKVYIEMLRADANDSTIGDPDEEAPELEPLDEGAQVAKVGAEEPEKGDLSV